MTQAKNKSIKILTKSLYISCGIAVLWLGAHTFVKAQASDKTDFYNSPIWQQQDIAIPFDPTIYDLAYQTFLATGNVSNAFLVAKAAVRQKPQDIVWRRHLARVATWNDQPFIALQQWTFLVKHEPELVKWQNAFHKALGIAKQIGDDKTVVWLMKLQAERKAYSKEDWSTLIAAQERLGHPEELIAQLREALHKKPSKFLQNQLLNLYRHTGQIDAELALLAHQEQEQGLTVKIALRRTEILYNQGKIKPAYDLLLQVKPKVKEDNKVYWQTLADLAWLVQNLEDSATAVKLLHARQEARPRDIIRLITLTRHAAPQHALVLAQEGWHKYRDDQFFFALLSIATELKDWKALHETFHDLTKDERYRLARSSLFWSARAETWQHLGHPALARESYEKALVQQPHSDLVKANYLWLLLRQQSREKLLEKIHAWRELQHRQFLWAPYANAYLYLGKPDQALKLFEQQWPQHQHDFIWLNQFAYVLDQTQQFNTAKKIRNLAWVELKKQLAKQNNPMTIEQNNIYADLVMYQAPGTTTAYTMAYLAAMATAENAAVDRETMINWALSQTYYDLAMYWRWQLYQAESQFPDWAALVLSIRQVDLTKVHDVLMRSGHRIPAREQVESTFRLADRAFAAQTTYNAMEQTPEDPVVQREMAEVMHESAHTVGGTVEKRQYSLLRATRAQLETAVFPTPNIKVMPYVVQQNQHSSDTTQLVNVPDHDRTLGFKTQFYNRHGYVMLDVMHRWALASFSGIAMNNVYRFNSRLNTQLDLGYNQNSTGTTPLRIAGAQDDVRFSFDYRFTVRDTLITTLEQVTFRSQKRHYLGNGYGIDGLFNHKFMFEDPDISISLLASAHSYKPSRGTLNGTLATIIAPGLATDFSFFVPESFRQVGASIQFGQLYKERYTQRIKPFASYGYYYNTLTGTGYHWEIGLASRVIGRDHLVLRFSEGTAQQDSEKETMVGIDYHYYYS